MRKRYEISIKRMRKRNCQPDRGSIKISMKALNSKAYNGVARYIVFYVRVWHGMVIRMDYNRPAMV